LSVWARRGWEVVPFPFEFAAVLRPPTHYAIARNLLAAPDEGDEEVVGLKSVPQSGTVNQFLIRDDALHDLLYVEVEVTSHDVRAELPENVVVRSRALRSLRLEAADDSTLVEFEQSFSCLARLAEVKLRKLVNRKDATLIDIEADLSISGGDPVRGSKDIFRSYSGQERPLAGATGLTCHWIP
jgi:hypothetical protein